MADLSPRPGKGHGSDSIVIGKRGPVLTGRPVVPGSEALHRENVLPSRGSRNRERRINVRTIFSRSILASMIVGLFFVAACAKRPVATVSQAPAPAPAPRPAPAP